MPLYEYDCPDCGRIFEKLVWKAGSAADVTCPQCGSRKVEERISSFASLQKGGSSSYSGGGCAPSG